MLAAIVLSGLLARCVVLAGPLSSGALDDPDNYLPLARSLAEGRGFALNGRLTAYRPPLYPLVLAPVVTAFGDRAAWGVAGLHLALGAGAILLTARAARAWGLGAGRALAASAVVALDPVLVSQARSVMTETLAAFLTAASLAALACPGWRGPALGGLGYGLGALCRPSALAAGVLTAAAAIVAGPGARRERAGRSVVLMAAMLATVAPWAVRNVFAVGEAVVATTHGGYTLYLANNPVYYDEVVNGPAGAVWTGPNQKLWWESINRSAAGLTEPEADRAMRAAALRVIADRPRDFVRASLARLGRFWGLAPAVAVYPRSLRLATALWTAPLWACLIAGLMTRTVWAWPRVAAPAALLALTLVHTVYWTDLRMRAPAVPAVALVAVGAFPGARNRSRPAT
jgi:4-amino-4-deoxy-L-arabinose transferase-like glycosyltransferase